MLGQLATFTTGSRSGVAEFAELPFETRHSLLCFLESMKRAFEACHPAGECLLFLGQFVTQLFALSLSLLLRDGVLLVHTVFSISSAVT